MKYETGASGCFIPDSDLSYEEESYRCKKCTELHGKVLPHQYADISQNSWIVS